MFYPVTTKTGEMALINLDQVFAFVEHNGNTIAIATGGSTFEIPMPLERLEKALNEFLEDED